MSKMVQIRNMPEAMHRKLKARAAMAGLALSDYIRLELQRSLERPTREELIARLAKSEPISLRPSAAALLRAERDGR
jgi:plasmid stability protein